MATSKNPGTIAIVIGASWTMYYLSEGFNVIAADPAPVAETELCKDVQDAWGLLVQHGITHLGFGAFSVAKADLTRSFQRGKLARRSL